MKFSTDAKDKSMLERVYSILLYTVDIYVTDFTWLCYISKYVVFEAIGAWFWGNVTPVISVLYTKTTCIDFYASPF